MTAVDRLRSSLARRRLHRIVHLLFACVLGVALYSPLGDSPVVDLLVRAVVFPALVASGVVLWKWPAVRRRLQSLRTVNPGLPTVLFGLTVLALALGFGHHVDHVVRGNHVGWPLTETVTAFTFSLLSYPLVIVGFLLTRRGYAGARFWVVLSLVLTAPLVLTHFGPTAIEPPGDIIGVYDHHAVGLFAFGWLVAFTLTMGLAVMASIRWWRRRSRTATA